MGWKSRKKFAIIIILVLGEVERYYSNTRILTKEFKEISDRKREARLGNSFAVKYNVMKMSISVCCVTLQISERKHVHYF